MQNHIESYPNFLREETNKNANWFTHSHIIEKREREYTLHSLLKLNVSLILLIDKVTKLNDWTLWVSLKKEKEKVNDSTNPSLVWIVLNHKIGKVGCWCFNENSFQSNRTSPTVIYIYIHIYYLILIHIPSRFFLFQEIKEPYFICTKESSSS